MENDWIPNRTCFEIEDQGKGDKARSSGGGDEEERSSPGTSDSASPKMDAAAFERMFARLSSKNDELSTQLVALQTMVIKIDAQMKAEAPK